MLEIIAQEKKCSLAFLVNEIDQKRQSKNLASHLRLFVLSYLKERVKLHAPSTEQMRSCPLSSPYSDKNH